METTKTNTAIDTTRKCWINYKALDGIPDKKDFQETHIKSLKEMIINYLKLAYYVSMNASDDPLNDGDVIDQVTSLEFIIEMLEDSK
jgi:hypothetical protein